MGALSELGIVLLKLLEGNSRTFRLGLVSLGLSLMVLGIAWALMLGGLGFIMWAFYLYLNSFLSSPVAALICGLVILLFDGVLILTTSLLRARPRNQKEAKAHFFSWSRHYPYETALGVLAAGFLVGVSPKVRKALAEGIIWFLKQDASEQSTGKS
jgi:hypothetical protein